MFCYIYCSLAAAYAEKLCVRLSKNADMSILISVCSVSSHPSEFVLPRELGKTSLHENASPFFAFLELRNSHKF